MPLLVCRCLQNAVCFQAQGAAARALTGSDSRSVVSWQHTCISGMFAGEQSRAFRQQALQQRDQAHQYSLLTF